MVGLDTMAATGFLDTAEGDVGGSPVDWIGHI